MRLQQILQNLVTNAIHYTPADGTITVHSWEAEGSAFVCVQDTGCGIAPEDQAAVFDRYFHTTANTKHTQAESTRLVTYIPPWQEISAVSSPV